MFNLSKVSPKLRKIFFQSIILTKTKIRSVRRHIFDTAPSRDLLPMLNGSGCVCVCVGGGGGAVEKAKFVLYLGVDQLLG